MGVSGVAGILKALQGLVPEADMDAATQAGAEVIASKARDFCQSSEVASTIDVELVEGDWAVTANHPRAKVEEFGTGPREGQRGPHNFPARSFLRRARDEGAQEAYETVADYLKERTG